MTRPQSHARPDTPFALTVNGHPATVANPDGTLLEFLRDEMAIGSVKDGCSPQGQCGCCTVLVDGKPRVACVTPVRRVRGRTITTIEGLDHGRAQAWAEAFVSCGATQCGFCTPGIIVRLDQTPPSKLDSALAAHQCRCTGWQTIKDAYQRFQGDGVERPGPDGEGSGSDGGHPGTDAERCGSGRPGSDAKRRISGANRRATIEARVHQETGTHVALGHAPAAGADAPADALVAVPASDGGWVVADTIAEALKTSGKVQGRRTTEGCRWPLEVAPADDGQQWDAQLRTTWVDGAYLEPDASWCQPGGQPTPAVGNGGGFGAKRHSWVQTAARTLADQHGRPVLAVARREDVARCSPKRPPVAGGATADGTGVLRVAASDDFAAVQQAVHDVAPGLTVEPVAIDGPPLSGAVRAAGWAEAAMLVAGAVGEARPVQSPDGAVASASFDRFQAEGVIEVTVRCGPVLDAVVLRSYCIGAAQMAWSWLLDEFLTVDATGAVLDLTMRSFMVLKASEVPIVEVTIEAADDDQPTNGSDAVFAAVAAAGWLALGCPPDLPVAQSSPEMRAELAARTRARKA